MPVRLDPFGAAVDHVIAIKHGGPTRMSNLALACAHCNGHKDSDIASLDPKTGLLVALFNPRRDRWRDHFRWEGPVLVGTTPSARATVRLLVINSELRITVRATLRGEGVDDS